MASVARSRWACTSRKYGAAPVGHSGHALAGQAFQGHHQRERSAAELGHLSLELVDAFGVVLVGPAEHLGLDLVDVFGDAFDGTLVPVDDEVRSPVQHTERSSGWQVAGAGVEFGAHLTQHVGVSVADGDDEVLADEDGDLDDLVGVDVPDRFQHREDDVVVHVELGPLVRLDGVLDREGRQVELGGDLSDLVGGGLLQPNPHEPVSASSRSPGTGPVVGHCARTPRSRR